MTKNTAKQDVTSPETVSLEAMKEIITNEFRKVNEKLKEFTEGIDGNAEEMEKGMESRI